MTQLYCQLQDYKGEYAYQATKFSKLVVLNAFYFQLTMEPHASQG